MKRLALIWIFIIGWSLAWVGPALAAWETRSQDTVIVKKTDTVNGDLWCSGSSVIIDGTVDGDLLVAASSVTVTGVVKGDVIGVVGDYTQSGSVEGNLRVIASNVNLQGTVGRNVSAWYVQMFRMNRNASVQDMWVSGLWNTGLLFEMDGIVHGNLQAKAEEMTVGGRVKGNSILMTDKGTGIIRLKSGAKLGSISYVGRSLNRVGATVGEIQKIPPENHGQIGVFLSWMWFLGTLMIGFVLTGFFPTRVIDWATGNIPWVRTVLTGFAIASGVLIAGVVLVVTGLGIPLALLIGLLFLAALIVCQLPTYIWLGASIVKFFRIEKRFPVVFLLLIGGVIIFLLSTIPFLGVLFSTLASTFGLGLLVRRPVSIAINPEKAGTEGNHRS